MTKIIMVDDYVARCCGTCIRGSMGGNAYLCFAESDNPRIASRYGICTTGFELKIDSELGFI